MHLQVLLIYLIFNFVNTSLNLTLSNLFVPCGKYTVDMLQMPLRYISHTQGTPLAIQISSGNDFPGPVGMTSIGFFLENNTVQCVAVKFFRGYYNDRMFHKRRNILEQIQEKLDKSQREHLIQLFDTGNALPYKEKIMVMELGDETFHERLYKRIEYYKNDEEIKQIICSLTVPIAEIHQMAIHMKISPPNYIYVSVNGEKLLKLKDVDNTKLTDSDDRNKQYLSEIDALDAFTAVNFQYMGPEYYDQISTKFDIWSLGMIIIEIHIDQLRLTEGKNSLTELNRGALLREIGNLYYGFERNNTLDNIGLNNKMEIFSNNSWIKLYKKEITIILKLWHKFPKTALLVTNLLHTQPELRLTARGILAYLNGACLPEEVRSIKSANELRLFKTIKIGEFKRQLTKKLRMNRLNLWRTENREMMSNYAQMRVTLKAIIKAQQQHIDDDDDAMDRQRRKEMAICAKE